MAEVADAEGCRWPGRGGRARARRRAARCAVGHPQPAARRRAARQGREGQQGGAQGRRAAEVRLRAEAALRDRRGAGPDGLRDGGEDFRRPLRRAEGRAGAAGARARRLHARPAHRPSSATPRTSCRCWSGSALRHGNCRSSTSALSEQRRSRLRESSDAERLCFQAQGARSIRPFWLIPTAEVSLTNFVREEILDEAKLPMRLHRAGRRASARKRAPPARTRAA